MKPGAKYIWIGGSNGFQSNQFLFFRKTFNISKEEVRNINIDIFADSRYILYLNGTLLGRGPLPSDPVHTAYDSYQAGEALFDGENVLAVMVCYYGNQTGNYIQGSPEFILNADIGFQNGSVQAIVTDCSWRCLVPLCWPMGGPRRSIWKSLIEIFDAREYPKGWNAPGYCDDKWSNAVELEEAPRHKIGGLETRDIKYLRYNKLNCHEVCRTGMVEFLQDPAVVFKYQMRDKIREIRLDEDIVNGPDNSKIEFPVIVNQTEGNSANYCVFDFGKDVVGRIGFKVNAPAGTVIDMVFREIEEKDVIQLSVAEMVNWKRYITSEGEQQWMSFEPEGFRFLQLAIHGNSSPLEICEVFVEEQRYPSERKGYFECSDERLNRLWDAAANTIQLSMQATYTDNPIREMGPWSGDIEYAKLVSYYVTGDLTLAARGLRQISYGQEASGRMPPIWPSGVSYSLSMMRCLVSDGKGMTPGFEMPHHSLQWISSVWRHYTYSGDLELLRELFPKLIKAWEWFRSKCDENGLLYNSDSWEDKWGWIDWEGLKDIWITLNFFHYESLHSLKSIAAELGEKLIENKLVDELEIKRRGLVQKYWSEEYCCFVDCYTEREGHVEPFFSEHTLSLALRYDLVPEGKEMQVVQRLENGLPDCSPVHKFHPYRALSQYGRHNKVLEEFRIKWSNMLSVNETSTIQEVWELDPEGVFCCCQSASAVPAFYLPAYILGVRPLKPAFEEFIVEPVPVDLKWAKGSVPTPFGIVTVEWNIGLEGRSLKVDVPDGYILGSSEKTQCGLEKRVYKKVK